MKRRLRALITALSDLAIDDDTLGIIDGVVSESATRINQGGKILICGNGGSHCQAMHFAEELTGRYAKSRKPLPALCLGDSGHLTCVANDFGFDQVFSRLVSCLGTSHDVLFVLSTSGNSQNLLEAIRVAHTNGLLVVGLLGKTGGKALEACDVGICVPSEISAVVQEVHQAIIHILVEGIESRVGP